MGVLVLPVRKDFVTGWGPGITRSRRNWNIHLQFLLRVLTGVGDVGPLLDETIEEMNTKILCSAQIGPYHSPQPLMYVRRFKPIFSSVIKTTNFVERVPSTSYRRPDGSVTVTSFIIDGTSL